MMSRVYIRDVKVIEAIIRKAQICHLAFSDGTIPYVIPMHFGYDNGTLYFHSGQNGKKMEILKKNPDVSFALETDVELVQAKTACEFTARFRSVVGFGRASIVEDREEKRKALSVLMRQYSEKSFTFRDEKLKIVAIIKVTVTEMMARVHGYDK
jgi:nitroimidazol reductase NimA-like FMN-containing flavoprotein (pyridoxamine 5'-phosphate oxidase superfamily)